MISKDTFEKIRVMVKEYEDRGDHNEDDFDIHFKDAAYKLLVEILKSESSFPDDWGGQDQNEDRFREELLKSLYNISCSLEKGIRIQQ